MEALMDNQGLVHIGERILKYLDFKTQINCRLVRKSWNQILEKEASKTKTELKSLLFAKERSQTKADLENLLKSIKESVTPFLGYFELAEKDKIPVAWNHFVIGISSKINNHEINVSLKKHIMDQISAEFSSLPLEHFLLKRDLEMIHLTLKQKLYYCKGKRSSDFAFYLLFAERDFDLALEKAVKNRYTDIVQCLKPFMTKDHYHKYVFEPAKNGELNVLKILYPNPNNTLMVDRFGNNPIHIAVSKGHTSIVNYFIQNGLGLVAQNNSGHTPLCYAFINNNHVMFNNMMRGRITLKGG